MFRRLTTVNSFSQKQQLTIQLSTIKKTGIALIDELVLVRHNPLVFGGFVKSNLLFLLRGKIMCKLFYISRGVVQPGCDSGGSDKHSGSKAGNFEEGIGYA